MRICLLVPSVYGMRGDTRSVVNLAGELAARHDVEILSVRRQREKPFFPVASGVKLSWVVDAQPGCGTCSRGARCAPRSPSGGGCGA